jgi:7,8-dihydropterin-6-yl-methyl-4-(beta-D-ribofuranosyl)aminobenzene 5'-phosphate synthase
MPLKVPRQSVACRGAVASQVDALIISHGHYDHVGGLIGFVETQRPRMHKDLRVDTGGKMTSAIATTTMRMAA